MDTSESNLWVGLTDEAQRALSSRDYSQEIAVDGGKLATADRSSPEVREKWIPGVEIFNRTIYPQRHRGSFGELARKDEGALATIGLWPTQWSAARMFAQTAKGFHIHPPHVPAGTGAADWFRRLFLDEAENYALRPYDREQWDVMFVLQGAAEMILRDARAGLSGKTMRLIIEGDNHRGPDNVAVVIPPGVAHALRVEGSEDLIMAYGTSTSFLPEFEGRIASDVESAPLPESWQRFLA